MENPLQVQGVRHQQCKYCLNVRWSSRYTYDPSSKWDFGDVFHGHCYNGASRKDTLPLLCGFCRHLRLEYLAFCLADTDSWPYADTMIMRTLPSHDGDLEEGCELCNLLAFPIGQSPGGYTLRPPGPTLGGKWVLDGVDCIRRLRGLNEGLRLEAHYSDALRLPFVTPRIGKGSQLMAKVSSLCLDNNTSPVSSAVPPGFRAIDAERRCVVTVRDRELPDYVALSYVWGQASGDPSQGALTSANLSELSEHIDFFNLPRAIRDTLCLS